jgi:hypothetical protein
MHDPDSNPYAPPATEFSAASPISGDSPQEYRIEKNVMILPPPFVLPEVCFLTGERQGLRQCEIPLKVMPKWRNNFIPVVMLAMQVVAFSIGLAAQKFKPNLPVWLSSPFLGLTLSTVVALTFAAVFLGIILGAKKKVTVTGFWTNSESVFRRRRNAVLLILIFDGMLVTGLLMAWVLFEGTQPLVGITLTFVPFAFVLTLILWMQNRKPWSRIGALQHADGSLAVYGLDPSFLAACRLGLDDSAAPPTQLTFA